MTHPLARDDLIIERPDLQTWRQRFGYGALTLLFWLLYAYLWLPLLSLLAWLAGLRFFYYEMFVLGGYEGIVRLLGLYASIIVVISAIYIGWALINYWRFKGVERRKAKPPVSAGEMAGYFGLDEADILAWQGARVAIVNHDAQGRVVGVVARNETGQTAGDSGTGAAS